MKFKASAVKKRDVTLPRTSALSLALALACASMGAQAAVDTSTWVSTKTQAFLPQVQVKNNVGAVVTADTLATEMVQGEQVHVVLSLNLRKEAQLDQAIIDVRTPGNPSFGQFLTPAQFAAQYAPTQAQVNLVVAHLQQAGFTGIEVTPNRLLISANGTAATVQQAFNTSLKHFTYQGRKVYANTAAAQVPASLGGIVNAVLGLQNVALNHTHSKLGGKVGGVALNNTLATASASVSTPVGTAVYHNTTDFPLIYNAASMPAASTTTVAIISNGDLAPTITDLAAFTTGLGLPAVNTTVVQTGPAGSDYSDTSGQVEWNLDSQTITGASGGTKELRFYAAPTLDYTDITTAYNRAVTDNVAKVINVSLGSCEADTVSSGTQAADDAVFKQAVIQGQTFSISTGDAGPYNCSVSTISGTPGVPDGKHYDVSEPASSPYVVAVGGTTLYTTGKTTFGSEAAWNEGLSPIGVYDGNGDSDPTLRLWATGGGYSKSEAAPIWQRLVNGNAKRALPDIAFDAASASGAIVYYDGARYVVGGTSLASPIFVGFWARIESVHSNRLGFPAPYFYVNFPWNPALVNDVTTGYSGADATDFGFKAKKGWDAATGYGSLNVAKVSAYISHNPWFWR
ncbi:S53 family peptidase [Glaciimonas soli]|nr:S53 family peptidase [Glaciimonas soli]